MIDWRAVRDRLLMVEDRPEEVVQEQLTQLAHAHKSGFKLNLPAIYAVSPVFALWSDFLTIALWVSGVTLFQLLNSYNARRFLKASAGQVLGLDALRVWALRSIGCSALYNCVWASAVPLFWSDTSQANNFLLIALMAVSVAPVVFLNSPYFPNVVGSTGSMAVIVLGVLLSQPDPVIWLLGVAYTLFNVTMVAYSYRMNGNVVATITHAIENDQLLKALSQAKKESDMARARAEDANRAKSLFLANMSHELRTPLNAIIGFSEVMIKEVFGPQANSKYHQYSVDIHESGQHLLALISDILDISKIESGQLTIADDEVDLVAAADDCQRLIALRASANKIRVELALSPNMPRLKADQRAISQIWLNLVTNAVKFAPSGSTVSLTGEMRPDGSLAIGVRDEGPGIAPDELDTVLQSFNQGVAGKARPGSGTGLGLSIVKGLVEAHGGRLILESEVDVGTHARATFPSHRVLHRTASSPAARRRAALAYP
ncbi:MAG: ATP-binding protein [Parvibaculaceae bacterium]